jgi:hypothetical protein
MDDEPGRQELIERILRFGPVPFTEQDLIRSYRFSPNNIYQSIAERRFRRLVRIGALQAVGRSRILRSTRRYLPITENAETLTSFLRAAEHAEKGK